MKCYGAALFQRAAAELRLIKMFLTDIFSLAVLIAKVSFTNSAVYLWPWPFACVVFVSAPWSVDVCMCVDVCKRGR